MKTDHADHEAAHDLGGSTLDTTASKSFLAALERIEQPEEDGVTFTSAEVRWHDATDDPGEAYVATVGVGTHPEAPVRLALEEPGGGMVVHAFTPDEAEARGWELIALAHLARKGG